MSSQLIRHVKVVEDDGGIVEIKMWQVKPSKDKPHGFKYSLVYIVGGIRVIGYDNAEKQGDHRHYRDIFEKYEFRGLRQLAKDFYGDIEKYKKGSL